MSLDKTRRMNHKDFDASPQQLRTIIIIITSTMNDFETQPIAQESYRPGVSDEAANRRLRRKTGKILVGSLTILTIILIVCVVFLFVLPN